MDENVQQPTEEFLSQQETKEAIPQPTPDPVEGLKLALGVEKDKYVRLLAEFDNMRKRHERDRDVQPQKRRGEPHAAAVSLFQRDRKSVV